MQSVLPLTHRIQSGGGIQIQAIKLNVRTENAELSERVTDVVEPIATLVKGQGFWTVNLEKLQTQILETGWVKEVSVSRSFPASLVVDLEAREPSLLVKSSRGWILVDDSGWFVSAAAEVSGAWAHLPVVFGLASKIQIENSNAELNRRNEELKTVIADLSSLIQEFRQTLKIHVETVQVDEEEWKGVPLFRISWTDSKGREVTATLLSGDWKRRLKSLQLVLSELKEGAVLIQAHFDGRIVVEAKKGG